MPAVIPNVSNPPSFPARRAIKRAAAGAPTDKPGSGENFIDMTQTDPAPRLPQVVDLLRRCAHELSAAGEVALALPLAQRALALRPDVSTHTLLAWVLEQAGDWRAALPQWRAAVACDPANPRARFHLARALLRAGDVDAGLALYEARIDKDDWTGFSARPARAEARARLLRPGDPLAGRDILVLTEQGLGDCIMFARYVPLLAAAGARVTLACSPALRPLFARLDGIATLLAPPADQPDAKLNMAALSYDAWVPLMSLALHLGAEAGIAASPWITPDPARVAAWRARYAAAAAGRRLVGLVHAANPATADHAARTIPLARLGDLLRPDIGWINLQHGPAGRDLIRAVPCAIDATATPTGLDDYAAAIAATDLLLTVDTMAAHLAGAIGHPAWVALPCVPNWFWQTEGASTPWYPRARLFRQPRPGEWAGTVAAMADALGRHGGITCIDTRPRL